MPGIANRIAKLEARYGSDMDRFLRSLTEEELTSRLAEATANIRTCLMSAGIDCSSIDDERVCEIAMQQVGATA